MSGGQEMTAWLRRRIAERLYLAQHAIELGNAAEWTELSSGVLMTCAPDDPQDSWDGVHPMGDSTLTRLMEANDPRDTIARCEAELGILDLYEKTLAYMNAPPNGEPANWKPSAGDYAAASWLLRGYQQAIALVAAGYRHWPGYLEEWAP